MTRYTIRDIGGALPWGTLLHFVQFLPRTSALSREMEPTTDTERWANGNVTAAILADIYDALSQLNNNVCAQGSGRRPRTAKPYPRPWRKGEGEKVVGSDPIPVAEFETWWTTAS